MDANAKLSADQLRYELGLATKYEIYNGILLCGNCHYKYDHWIIGIDEDGYLWKKENGNWQRDRNINIFPNESAKTKHYYPDSNCLRWKFNRFDEKRDRLVTRMSNVLASIFLTPPAKSKKKY